MSEYAQNDAKQSASFILRVKWVMNLVFCMWSEISKVTNLFNHFKQMCSDVPKVIQNNKLDFLHIGRLQQKQPIAGGISKILVGGVKSFLPAANFHGHEL